MTASNVSSRSLTLLACAVSAALMMGPAVAQTAAGSPAAAPTTDASIPAPCMMGGPGKRDRAQRQSGDRHAAMMQWVDADRDGQISRAEIDAAHQKMAARTAAAFEKADVDRDGKLSQTEMVAFRQAMHPEAMREGAGRHHGGSGAHGGHPHAPQGAPGSQPARPQEPTVGG